jgi:hypothetical protein
MALWLAGGTSKKLGKVVVLDVRREKKGATIPCTPDCT